MTIAYGASTSRRQTAAADKAKPGAIRAHRYNGLIAMVDLIVIGAGPVGLACAIEAQRENLTACVLEKGALVNSLVGYPANMEFFSTPELIEIGGFPFPVQGYKPTREQAIEYYRGVAAQEKLDIRLYERVLAVNGEAGNFTVVTDRGE